MVFAMSVLLLAELPSVRSSMLSARSVGHSTSQGRVSSALMCCLMNACVFIIQVLQFVYIFMHRCLAALILGNIAIGYTLATQLAMHESNSLNNKDSIGH